MYIKIEKNPDGSHTAQSGGIVDEGWAYIPKNIAIPATFPFVEFEYQEVYHPAVTTPATKIVDGELVEYEKVLIPEYTQFEVTAMTEGEEIIIEEEPVPTQLDIIEAQVAYTAMMTDTLLEE